MIPLSILDLAPITDGGSAARTFANTVELARLGERLGYRRYWLAEHHNMPGIASAATAVLIGHVAGATERIRVGSGGVMLPNHAPLQVAEQFGTLAALYPGRIDLGLGRAPGTDQAVPGAGEAVEAWILGSSLFGAQLAAMLGLPYAFASHFAPTMLEQALATYRAEFRPSARLAQPHVMLAMNVVAAETDAESQRLFTTQQQAFVRLRRRQPVRMPPPLESAEAFDGWCSPAERVGVEQALACSAIGTPQTVAAQVSAFTERHRPDELIFTTNVYEHAARMRSFELTMQACGPAAA